MTRYVVVGAGAVGSALGGLMAQQGADVLLAARGDHARAMAEHGLTVRCRDATLTVPGQTQLTLDDVLVLTTKTHQAEVAISEWADVPVHADDGVVGRAADLPPIFTALNGVGRRGDRAALFRAGFRGVRLVPDGHGLAGRGDRQGAPLRGVFHIGRYGGTADPSGDATLLDGLTRDGEAAGRPIRRPEAVMAWKYRSCSPTSATCCRPCSGHHGPRGSAGGGRGRGARDSRCRRRPDRR